MAPESSAAAWRRHLRGHIVRGPHNADGGLKVPIPGGYERTWHRLMGIGTWQRPATYRPHYLYSGGVRGKPAPIVDWTRGALAWSAA